MNYFLTWIEQNWTTTWRWETKCERQLLNLISKFARSLFPIRSIICSFCWLVNEAKVTTFCYKVYHNAGLSSESVYSLSFCLSVVQWSGRTVRWLVGCRSIDQRYWLLDYLIQVNTRPRQRQRHTHYKNQVETIFIFSICTLTKYNIAGFICRVRRHPDSGEYFVKERKQRESYLVPCCESQLSFSVLWSFFPWKIKFRKEKRISFFLSLFPILTQLFVNFVTISLQKNYNKLNRKRRQREKARANKIR